VLLLVFVGMLALCWKLASGQHDLATLLAQALARTAPPLPTAPGAAPPAPAAPVSHPAPQPAPKPTGAFADAPPWFQLGVHDIGFHETGNNGGIELFISQAHCGAVGDPWCAIWSNAKLELSGITGTRSPSSQSFRFSAGYVQLAGPALGALAIFWRGSQTSGLGHVGFYRGEDANSVWTLGGNENDMVQIEALPKSSASFGLIGYWWPKAVPLPTIGPVLMPMGSPTHVQVPPTGAGPAPATSAPAGLQTNITATMFGGQQSAYGGPIIDAVAGVALPFRFNGVRPRVRVTGVRSGVSIDCDVVDVGPWNGITAALSDPYWTTGARPQAESGTDLNGRKTNKAGIDLTLAAAQATGVDGKGLVSWQFIEPQPPTVT
jgi:uncharacterized protein (TIGR02594 family)